MTATHLIERAQARSRELVEEAAWLASFGWSQEQIARRLGVTVDGLIKARRRNGEAT